MAVMMSALSRPSQANKLKQPAITTGAVIRCTGPCGHQKLSNGTFSTRKKKKKKKFTKTSYLINLAKILMKTRQVSIGKLLHFLTALLQSSQQADGNLGIKKPWVLKSQTSKFTSQVCKAPCQLGKSPGKLPWIYSNPVASQVSSSLRSLLAVGKPDSRSSSLLGFKDFRNLVKAWIHLLKEPMPLQK